MFVCCSNFKPPKPLHRLLRNVDTTLQSNTMRLSHIYAIYVYIDVTPVTGKEKNIKHTRFL